MKEKYTHERHEPCLKHFSSLLDYFLFQGQLKKPHKLILQLEILASISWILPFLWILFFQPGTQIQILMLDLDRRHGNKAKQNLCIVVIIIQNKKDTELLQP